MLTVQQRRREIIDLLAHHAAHMPEALDIPLSRPGSSPEFEHASASQDSRRRSQKDLELSAN
jgi:hypothetical protein